MGYDLHITRKSSWLDEDGPRITLSEWRLVVSSDPEMQLTQRGDLPFVTGAPNGEEWGGYAVWTGKTKLENALFWIDSTGDIVSKNPERSARVKMFTLARKLDAKVQGDDGEFYDSEGKPTESPQTREQNGLFAVVLSVAGLFIGGAILAIFGPQAAVVLLLLCTVIIVVLGVFTASASKFKRK